MEFKWQGHLKCKYYMEVISKISKIVNQNIGLSRKQDSHGERYEQVRSCFGSGNGGNVLKGRP